MTYALPNTPVLLGPAASGLQYQKISLIAEGGMGAVYLGHAKAPVSEPVAIKVTLGSAAAKPMELARFQREIAAVAGLNHPNIVRTLDYGRDARFGPFIVMELLKGETLEDLLDRRPYGRLSLEEASRIALPVCGALIYAHTRTVPLIHRDIKPANVYLCAGGAGDPLVKVMDFGLARSPDAFPEGVGARQKLTEAGIALGTLQYIAPEQCEGRPCLASDIYALGVMLYRMIEGRFPYPVHVKDPLDLIRWHRHGTPEDMTECPKPSVRGLIARMLEKNPLRRPSLGEVHRGFGNDASPTLVGIPIVEAVASEMPTLRCAAPEPAVPEPIGPDQDLTIRDPRLQSRVAAGEISMPAVSGEPSKGPSDKIFFESAPRQQPPARPSLLSRLRSRLRFLF
jgi:serine/threonine-protein kinase